jgi:membrane protein YqaA with SNARE-associated domain
VKHLIQTLIAWGPHGLLLLAIADSAGVPIVGGVDALLIAVSARRPEAAYWSAACAVIGSLIGCSILFGIARKGGEVFLAKYISHGQGKRLHNWFERYGLVTVFIPAASFIPLPMKIPVFCAGALEVRWSAFLVVVFCARVLRYFALAFLAQRYGLRTFAFIKVHALATGLAAAAIALLLIVFLRLVQQPQKESTAVDI